MDGIEYDFARYPGTTDTRAGTYSQRVCSCWHVLTRDMEEHGSQLSKKWGLREVVWVIMGHFRAPATCR